MADVSQIRDQTGTDRFETLFHGVLVEALGDRSRVANVERLGEHKGIDDDTQKLIVHDSILRPVAVLLYSSDVSPDLVKRGMDNAREAKSKLGNSLGSVILDPLGQGKIDGKSYGILPFREPISKRKVKRYLQVRRLYPGILRWLKDITAHTATYAHPDNIQRDFIMPLEHIAHLQDINDEIRFQARRLIGCLESGEWIPKHVLMHGDFWIDNFLLNSNGFRKRGPYGFVLIDWPGCLLEGYAIYDLVRFARSIGLAKRAFTEEVSHHCRILGCVPGHAMGYLLAALGHIGLNLEHFPFDRYVTLISDCYLFLTKSIKAFQNNRKIYT